MTLRGAILAVCWPSVVVAAAPLHSNPWGSNQLFPVEVSLRNFPVANRYFGVDVEPELDQRDRSHPAADAEQDFRQGKIRFYCFWRGEDVLPGVPLEFQDGKRLRIYQLQGFYLGRLSDLTSWERFSYALRYNAWMYEKLTSNVDA